MLTKDEKKQLRKVAHTLPSLFQVGKDGVGQNMIKSIHDALEAHELVKVNLLKTCGIDVREAAFDISAGTKSEIVQIVGHTFVLYRRSKKNKMDL